MRDWEEIPEEIKENAEDLLAAIISIILVATWITLKTCVKLVIVRFLMKPIVGYSIPIKTLLRTMLSFKVMTMPIITIEGHLMRHLNTKR